MPPTVPQDLLDALAAAEQKLSDSADAQAALAAAVGAAQEAASKAESARHVADVALDQSHRAAQDALELVRAHFGLGQPAAPAPTT